MAVTKKYIDMASAGIVIHSSRPTSPKVGDVYFDMVNNDPWIYEAVGGWVQFSSHAEQAPAFYPPTSEELEKHPALKEAWEEFLVIKKLLGI